MSESDVVEIKKIEKKTPTIKSLFFEWDKKFKPGQFVMVWIPGLDEVPMAVAKKEKEFITVKERGKATQALHNMKPGDRIGIRGPFGNSYSVEDDPLLFVTGGCGGASLIQAVYEACKSGKEIRTLIGGKSEEELLFREEFSDLTDLSIATEDGSAGRKGLVTEMVPEVLEEEEIGSVLTCGPEIMMEKVVDMCVERNVPVQASLERYMKCGIGICDSCSIDGKQVCKDGPIFDGKELKNIVEFGKYERTKEGILEEL